MAERITSSEITVIPSSETALWDNFVYRSVQGTFFHTSTWANVIRDTFQKNYKIVCCVRNDQITGGILFFYHHKIFWNIITPTPLFPFTAPLYYQPPDEKRQRTTHNELSLTSQFNRYLNDNYSYWVLDTPATKSDLRAFQWNGALVEPRYTYKISLDNLDQLTSNFSQSVRKKIKQAELAGYTITEEKIPEKLIELVNRSYLRHRIKPLINTAQLRSLLDVALTIKQIKMYSAILDGEITASRLIVSDEKIIYDLLAGSNDPLGVGSTFLVSYILKKYLASHTHFDFMGADHPEIEKFKRGFGGELESGFRITNKVKIPLSWIVKLRKHQQHRQRKL